MKFTKRINWLGVILTIDIQSTKISFENCYIKQQNAYHENTDGEEMRFIRFSLVYQGEGHKC